ncbi:MAG: PDZ domain-containing protein [Ruminiclostridium sp.]|nr:PDZ domain-containing protein [Ruminiclostridium sp.]
MNRKVSLGIAISIAAIACAVTFVITMTVSLNNYNGKIADVQQRGEIYTKLQEIDSYVRNYSLYTIDDEKMKTGVYSGYLTCLDDSGAKYYTTDEYYYKTRVESGNVVGLGIVFEKEESGYIKITEVYGGSPADAGGILPGDVIISVEGVSVLESGYAAAGEQLRYGDEGTRRKFVVRRDGEETEYDLARTAFSIPTVEAVLLDNGILCFTFSSINEATGAKMNELLSHYEESPVTGYIFDLRGVSSGVYSSVAEILGHFVDEGVIASAVYKNNSTKIVAQTPGGDFTKLPISIIIDEKTGGSAELIAEALRDHADGITVGENTMGSGTLRETRTFNDGTAIEISVAVIRTSAENGDYNEVGITPEFAVEYDGEREIDPSNFGSSFDIQLKKAVEVIAVKAAAAAEAAQNAAGEAQ